MGEKIYPVIICVIIYTLVFLTGSILKSPFIFNKYTHHDGKYAYYVALDPFKNNIHVDSKIRYTRILYPLLSNALSRIMPISFKKSVAIALVILNITFTILTLYNLCKLLPLEKKQLILIGVFPIIFVSTIKCHLLPLSLLITTLFFIYLKKNKTIAFLIICAGVLTKEILLLLLIPFFTLNKPRPGKIILTLYIILTLTVTGLFLNYFKSYKFNSQIFHYFSVNLTPIPGKGLIKGFHHILKKILYTRFPRRIFYMFDLIELSFFLIYTIIFPILYYNQLNSHELYFSTSFIVILLFLAIPVTAEAFNVLRFIMLNPYLIIFLVKNIYNKNKLTNFLIILYVILRNCGYIYGVLV